MIWTIIIAIIMFSVIVIFHELGHFLLAKANGIQVNEFSLGLGPTLVGFTKGETKYSLKLLPFGGACMMEGEDDGSENPRAFNNKSVWARISVVAAGPVFNFIMAFIVAYIMISISGYNPAEIDDVTAGYSAEEQGLQAGDVITKVNGFHVYSLDDLNAYLTIHGSEEDLDITYKRDGEKYQTTLEPTYSEEDQRYYYGLQWNYGNIVKDNPFANIAHAAQNVRYNIYVTVQSLKMLVTGKAGFNDLSGPVGIVSYVGETTNDATESGGVLAGFLMILNWTVLISANLGVMNLLPIPALDGGRLLFLIVEAIRRKKIDPQKEGYVHGIGIIILLLLMVAVMFNDIRKLF